MEASICHCQESPQTQAQLDSHLPSTHVLPSWLQSIPECIPIVKIYSSHYHEGSPIKPYCRSLVHVAFFLAGPLWSALVTLSPFWIFICFADQFLLLTSLLLHIPQHRTQQGYTMMRAIDMFAVFLAVTANLLPALNKSGGVLLVMLTLLEFLLLFCVYVHYSKQWALFLGIGTVMLVVLMVFPANALIYISLACFVLAGILYTFPDNDLPNTAWRIFQLKDVNLTGLTGLTGFLPNNRLLFASHDAVQWLGAIIMLCMLRVNHCLLFE